MLANERRERGSALIMALVLVVIVLGYSGAVLGYALARSQAVQEEIQLRQAFWAAESGVSVALTEINAGGDGNVTGGMAGCTFSVEAREPSPGVILLYSNGTRGGREAATRVMLEQEQSSIFDRGLFGDRDLRIGRGASSDSVDASVTDEFGNRVALASQTGGDRGDVGSNGRVRIQRGATINGDVTSAGLNKNGRVPTRFENKVLLRIDRESTIMGSALAQHGTVRVQGNGHVLGDVGTSNGNVRLDNGTVVDGNAVSENGSIDNHPQSTIAGDASVGPGGTVRNPDAVQGAVTTGLAAADVPPEVLPPAPTGDGVDATLFARATAASNDNRSVPDSILSANQIRDRDRGRTFDLTVGNGQNVVLPPGNYIFSNLRISNGGSLTFAGAANVVVEGDMTVDTRGTLEFASDAAIAVDHRLDAHHDSTLTFRGDVQIAANDDVRFRGQIGVAGNAMIDAGDRFEIKNDSAALFQGDLTIDAGREVRFDGHAAIETQGQTIIYADRRVELRSAVINNATQDPSNFLVFVAGTRGKAKVKLDLSTDIPFYGAIYAPTARVDVKHHHMHPEDTHGNHNYEEDLETTRDRLAADEDRADDAEDGGHEDVEDDPDQTTQEEIDDDFEHGNHRLEEIDLYGAVIGRNVRLDRLIQFHYDLNLRNLFRVPTTEGYVVATWGEMPPAAMRAEQAASDAPIHAAQTQTTTQAGGNRPTIQ